MWELSCYFHLLDNYTDIKLLGNLYQDVGYWPASIGQSYPTYKKSEWNCDHKHHQLKWIKDNNQQFALTQITLFKCFIDVTWHWVVRKEMLCHHCMTSGTD